MMPNNIATGRDLPSAQEADSYRESLRKLVDAAAADGSVKLRLGESDSGEHIELSARAVNLIKNMLQHLAEGNGVSVVALPVEMSPRDASELLRVSCEYFEKLLDQGRIPYQVMGRSRRVRREDLLRFKVEEQRKRRAALDQLAAESQEFGIGYD